ncbi:MAG: hypothetical protein D6682_03120 [Zetaproteobacteria bacterium]|nr:MAG: hypothetical protein D6682_03120 [Zetaproteobacteria bacterium]
MLPECEEKPKRLPLPDNWPGLAQGLEQTVALLRRGEEGKAEQMLRDLAAFAPSDPRVWYLFGKLEQRRGAIARARVHYRKAKRLREEQQPQQAEEVPGSMRIAKLLHSQGETAQALAMLDRLLARRPDDMRLIRLKHRWEREGQGGAHAISPEAAGALQRNRS